jgi:hypothetical protein
MQSLFRIILKKSAFLFITRSFWVHKSAFFPWKVKTTPIFSPKSRVTKNPQYEKTHKNTKKYTKRCAFYNNAQKPTNSHTKTHHLYKKVHLLSRFERGILF